MNILIFIHERFRMFCLWKKKKKQNDYTKKISKNKISLQLSSTGGLGFSRWAQKKTLNRLTACTAG